MGVQLLRELVIRGAPEIPLAYSACENVAIGGLSVGLLFEIRRIVKEVRSTTNPESLERDPVLSKYRLFAEPRGSRPGLRVYPEVLIRRVLSGREFPHHSPLIDISNAVSMITRVPMSPIDLDRAGPVLRVSRLAREMVLRDLAGKSMTVPRGSSVLVDARGRVIYVYPYKLTDTAPASASTKRVVFIGYGAPGVPVSLLVSSVRMVVNYVVNHVREAVCSETEVELGSGAPQ